MTFVETMRNEPDALVRAITITNTYHAKQKDLANLPYVLHPLAVMQMMETEIEKIVASLHDVLEDTECTESDLVKFGFSAEVIAAVVAITNLNEPIMSLDQYLDAVGANPIALKVKLNDIMHNSSLPRIMQHASIKRINKLNKKYTYCREYLKKFV